VASRSGEGRCDVSRPFGWDHRQTPTGEGTCQTGPATTSSRPEAPSMEGRPMIDHRRRARCIPSDEAEFAVFVDAALGGLASEGDRDVVAFCRIGCATWLTDSGPIAMSRGGR
jgi:hypothetical protein